MVVPKLLTIIKNQQLQTWFRFAIVTGLLWETQRETGFERAAGEPGLAKQEGLRQSA